MITNCSGCSVACFGSRSKPVCVRVVGLALLGHQCDFSIFPNRPPLGYLAAGLFQAAHRCLCRFSLSHLPPSRGPPTGATPATHCDRESLWWEGEGARLCFFLLSPSHFLLHTAHTAICDYFVGSSVEHVSNASFSKCPVCQTRNPSYQRPLCYAVLWLFRVLCSY